MTKILVIEDEEFVRENLLELLLAESFDAIGAPNGLLGVELAREQQPDLIISDIMMPKLDGYGVLKALRSDRETAGIPFIFLTAKSEKLDWRQGMEMGADDYLTKPCTPSELLKAIATRLEKQAAAVARYATEIQQVEDKLYRLIYYDGLTNLPNRLLLREQFERVLDASQGEKVAVIVLELDRFNRIKHSLGHAGGEALLKAVASRLLYTITSPDVVARLEKEQFAIIRVISEQRQQVVAQGLLDSINRPFALEGQEYFLTASMGMGFYPDDGKDIETLLQAALRSLAYAQQQGGNQYQFYTRDLHRDSTDILALETSLRYALEREELEVYYQPKVSLKSGKIVGAEALLRWQHPKRGLVSPARFIPIAESTGLIVPIGEWVLQRTCSDVKYWQTLGFDDFKIAVNLSARQFLQADLLKNLVEILRVKSFDPKYLELELTESILMKDVETGLKILAGLQEMGIKIALDDFGTGYSSLSYLQQFTFDILKIDRSFVHKLTKKNIAMIEGIMLMARHLHMKVIAEGVERRAELNFLRQHNCDEIQGYLFSPPVQAEAFKKLLLGGKKLLLDDI